MRGSFPLVVVSPQGTGALPSARVWEATDGILARSNGGSLGKDLLSEKWAGREDQEDRVCGLWNWIIRGHHRPELGEERKTGPPVLSRAEAASQQLGARRETGSKCPGLSSPLHKLPPVAKSPWEPAVAPRSQVWPLELRAGAGAWEWWIRRNRGRLSSTFSFPLLKAKSIEQSLFPLFYRNGFCGKPGKINPANNYVSV